VKPFPYPLLVADVGGTNARFSLRTAPDAPEAATARVATAAFPGFVEAVRSREWPIRPRALIVCAAGPLEGRRIALTNAEWSFDGDAIADGLDLEQGLLLNDFEALALAAPILPESWSRPVGPPCAADPDGVRLVVGAGTGLGVGFVAPVGGRWRALASEGGHIDLAPLSAEEEAIWAAAERVEWRITPESMLAGAGLTRLHRARETVAGRQSVVTSPADLVARAEAAPLGPEAETLRHAWRILGRVVGDYALVCLPTGGVLLAGGVLPRIAGFLDAATFRAAFENKAPMRAALARMPIRLLTRDDAALAGMAALGGDPDRYDIAWSRRLWR
jgi:glucokinase